MQLESKIRSRKDSLGHVDACLKLLDPNCAVEDIPNKRIVKHVNLFRQGELGRLILGTLREVDGMPLAAADVVGAIMTATGYGEDARPALRARVRSNLAYLERRGRVVKIGERGGAKWKLPV